MMWAFGPMEILLLMALGGGGQTADLASFLPADIYFRSRDIPITAESMVRVASKLPDDGKARVERISFAFAEGKEAKDPGRMFVRIGGKADHQRVVDAVKKLSRGFPVQETKDAKGLPIATMPPAEKGVPAIALIGDTDLV